MYTKLCMMVMKKQTLKVKSHSALSITLAAYSRDDTILKVTRHNFVALTKKIWTSIRARLQFLKDWQQTTDLISKDYQITLNSISFSARRCEACNDTRKSDVCVDIHTKEY